MAVTDRPGDRYLPESAAHPDRTPPGLAAELITRHTVPGDVVVDPMAGIGTSLVEAVHLDRHAFGVELVPQWASVAQANLRLARRHGAPGYGVVACGDARLLPMLIPERLQGRVALILAFLPRRHRIPCEAAPRGAALCRAPRSVSPAVRQLRRWADGYCRAEHPRRTACLDRASWDRVPGLLAEILTACAAILRPGGTVVFYDQFNDQSSRRRDDSRREGRS